MSIESIIKGRQAHANALLERSLSRHSPDARLLEAMRYVVLNGGKRLRAMLAFAAAEALGGQYSDADSAAVAVELIHAYSLVHDDLPAMDDDELRRGKPTCHIAFDEATAILAGDALQALAFEVLCEPDGAAPAQLKLEMVRQLASAAGLQGMVGGQSIDVHAAGELLDEASLSNMHSLKTGALIKASILLGAMSTGKASERQLVRLAQFADLTGLAFQVKDDILDVEGDTSTLGKQQGKDQNKNKPTYTSMLGLEGARERLEELHQQSLELVAEFGEASANLKSLARYIIERIY